MSKRVTLVACGLSALTLAACSNEPEPMAQTTTPIYAKDGTIIGQTVVVPQMDSRTPESTGIISETGNMSTDLSTDIDGSDDDSSDDDDG